VLVVGRDPADLAAALDGVLHDDALRSRLAAAGPARAATWPTEQDTAAAVAAALGRVLLLAWDSVER
jgi:glycosyltransferase involved in cell wall biosynthesis